MIRFLAALATIGSVAWAQFDGLATPYDGSAVYFASTLRLKGEHQPIHGKLFVAGERGVRLFRAREKVELPASALPCTLGEFYAFLGAEVSADGSVIAATMERPAARGCTYPPNVWGAALISAAGEIDVPGAVRLSHSGRYAIVFNAVTARPFSYGELYYLHLPTGTRIPIRLPAGVPNNSVFIPFLPTGGRVIADDGTAILSRYDQPSLLARPGMEPEPFPVAQADPLVISADGARILYVRDGLRLLNLRTNEDRLVFAAGDGVYRNRSMSDDGERVLLLLGGQAHVIQTDGTGLRALTSHPSETIQKAILSGNGRIAYAVTSRARLIKIDAGTGEQTEIVGRTPYLNPFPASVGAGLAATVEGAGLSDVSLRATPPLKPWLGNLTMWIEGRKVPMLEVTPGSVRFIVPWDIAPGRRGGQVRVVAETPGVNSPFDSPDTYVNLYAGPRAGAIVHENWDGLVSAASPPRRGEIIHIFAVGLGAVNPEPPEGTAAPVEPLARLASPLVCSDSDVLHAGLAPGHVERVYQVDLRIGDVTGYTQFKCSLGGGDEFIFVSLNVLP